MPLAVLLPWAGVVIGGRSGPGILGVLASRGPAAVKQPVAVMLLGILNFVPDNDEAIALVSRLVAALPSGSFVAISHPTTEINGDVMIEALRLWNEGPSAKMVLRSRDEVAQFFPGLELVEPGVVTCSHWRPDPQTDRVTEEVPHYGGVGRKV